MAVMMQPNDSVYGSLAEVYVTIDGNRYNMMQLYEFESKVSLNITDVPILGRLQMGKKAAGFSGTWSGTAKNLRFGWSPVVCFRDGSEAASQLEQMGAYQIGMEDLRDLTGIQMPDNLLW